MNGIWPYKYVNGQQIKPSITLVKSKKDISQGICSLNLPLNILMFLAKYLIQCPSTKDAILIERREKNFYQGPFLKTPYG